MRSTREERHFDQYVDSPTRTGKSAVEVVFAGSVTPSGGAASNYEIRNAGETLSALKCVYSFNANTIKYATNNSALQNALVFGLTITAAQINESNQVQTSGTLRDSSFNYSAGTILYLGLNGNLTDTAPTVGFLTQVAVSQGIGQIFINIKETTQL